MTIKTKLLIMVLGIVAVVSIATTIESVMAIKSVSNSNIKQYKKEAFKTKEEELNNYTTIAINIIDTFYKRSSKDKIVQEVKKDLLSHSSQLFNTLNIIYKTWKNRLTKEELKRKIIFIINNNRYGKNGYFWVNDLNGVMITHPIMPQLNGKNLYNFKDNNGKEIFKEFIKVAKKYNSGFVDYVWPKPGHITPQAKISYVKLFKPFNWIIGTGAYVDDVTNSLKEEAITSIKNLRYCKNGYFWITDTKPRMIMHPIETSLDGKDLSNIKDPNGVYLFNEMVKVSKNSKSGGLVKYFWPKPGEKKPQLKLSYVKRFEPWDWIIGTGVYVDDIQNQILKLKQETNKRVSNTIWQLIFTILLMIIPISLINIYFLNHTIIKPLNKFENGLLNFFKYLNRETSEAIHLDTRTNDEIGSMSKVINDNIIKTKKAIKEAEQKDKAILQQSRLAQMGEMLSMIAHQWRQPLAAISSVSTNIILKAKLNKLDNKSSIELANKIAQYTQHLSSTIDDFREFFKPNKGKRETTYDEVISSVLNIAKISLTNNNIKLITNLQSKERFLTYPNELKQVILNLIKNAEDILLERGIEDPTITIETKENILRVKDNAKGVPKDIIEKIFDPYFSTKTKKDGTGLGLYMSKTIIEEHCKGKLRVYNDEFGAVFEVELPTDKS